MPRNAPRSTSSDTSSRTRGPPRYANETPSSVDGRYVSGYRHPSAVRSTSRFFSMTLK